MANGKRICMVKLKPETHARLAQFIAALTKARMTGNLELGGFLPAAVSADTAIQILLDRQDAHKERSAKSTAKRKQSEVNQVNQVNQETV